MQLALQTTNYFPLGKGEPKIYIRPSKWQQGKSEMLTNWLR